MTKGYIITGTDTGVGKTVFAAMLTAALAGIYWKPVQSGLLPETDMDVVKKLTGLPSVHFLPEAYRLTQPLSPNLAAEIDGRKIDVRELHLPAVPWPLIVEGAGGVMVPLTPDMLYIDVFQQWHLPVILCARTTLGTINHTLLSIEALQNRRIPLHGIVFIGPENDNTIKTIAAFSKVKVLGHLPMLENLDQHTLATAFTDHFRKTDFLHV